MSSELGTLGNVQSRTTSAFVPLIAPVQLIIPAGTTVVVPISENFLGVAVSFLISNLDASNNATYQINGSSAPVLILASGAFRTISDTQIRWVKITAGASGDVQLELQVQLFREISSREISTRTII